MIARVTTGLEVLGILVLTTALGLAVHQRAGLIWALVAAGLALFAWSWVVELVRGEPRHRPPQRGAS